MGQKKSARIDVNVGDYVLVGTTGVTMPLDWFTAQVLWVGPSEILTHHATPTTSEGFRQVLSKESIIGVGTLGDLIDYREHCWRAVEEQEQRVRACEQELSKARHEVWQRLDELRAKGRSPSEDSARD